MARNVGFDIEVGDKGATTTPAKAATALERLAARLDDAGRAAEKTAAASEATGHAVDSLGEQARQASGAVDNLGDQMRQATGDAGRLATAVELTRARHGELLRQLERTGDVDLVPQIRNEAGLLRTLSRMRSDLTDLAGDAGHAAGKVEEIGSTAERVGRSLRNLGDDAKAGFSQIGTSFSGGISGFLSIGAGPIAAMAAPIVPALGAAVSEGILLGIGTAGIATGIAAAAKGPEVVAAWKTLASDAAAEFERSGYAFRAPVVDAIGAIRTELSRLDLASVIRPLAATIEPLTSGLMGLVDNVMPGIRTAAAAAVGPINALAQDLPGVGAALSDMLQMASAGGEGGARAMTDLLVTIEAVARAAGAAAGVLGEIYGFADKAGWTGLLGLLGNLTSDEPHGKLVKLGTDGSASLNQLGTAATSASAALQTVKQVTDALSGANVSAMQTEATYQAAVDAASASVAAHGHTLNLDTEAGRANQQALLEIRSASVAAAEATYAQTLAAQGESAAQRAASEVWDRGRNQLISLAQSMGMSAAQAQDLANKIMGIPNWRQITIGVDISAAEAALDRIRGEVNDFTASAGRSLLPGEAAQYYGQMSSAGRAGGGPVYGPGTETSDSILTPLSKDEHVWTAAEVRGAGGHSVVAAMRHAALTRGTLTAITTPPSPSTASSAATGAAAMTLVIDSRGSRLDDLLVEVLRAAIDRDGGNVQDTLGRRGVTA